MLDKVLKTLGIGWASQRPEVVLAHWRAAHDTDQVLKANHRRAHSP